MTFVLTDGAAMDPSSEGSVPALVLFSVPSAWSPDFVPVRVRRPASVRMYLQARYEVAESVSRSSLPSAVLPNGVSI